MCWRGRWVDRVCLCFTRSLSDLADDAHGTIDEGKVALLEGACVGEVDGLTECDFDTIRLAHRLHIAPQTKAK